MPGRYVSVAEAAALLGVHPQRVHQRIRDGSLTAEKIGHQWVIDRAELRYLSHHATPGRPLSITSAWDLIAVAHGAQACVDLSAPARSRARSRLRNLLTHARSGDLEDVAARTVKALRNRAGRALFTASPRDLPGLRDDPRLHLSGASLPESGISFGDGIEGYVTCADLDALIEDHLLTPAARSHANVILHVVSPDAGTLTHESLRDVVRSPLVLAADLAEHDGIREKNQAVQCLSELSGRLLTHPAGTHLGTHG